MPPKKGIPQRLITRQAQFADAFDNGRQENGTPPGTDGARQRNSLLLLGPLAFETVVRRPSACLKNDGSHIPNAGSLCNRGTVWAREIGDGAAQG